MASAKNWTGKMAVQNKKCKQTRRVHLSADPVVWEQYTALIEDIPMLNRDYIGCREKIKQIGVAAGVVSKNTSRLQPKTPAWFTKDIQQAISACRVACHRHAVAKNLDNGARVNNMATVFREEVNCPGTGG